ACNTLYYFFFFFQAEDGIRDRNVTGVQTCALPIFWLFCMEIPVQQIGGDFAYFTLVRTIFFGSYTANQPHLFHKPLHGLVVQKNPFVAKCDSDSSVAVSASVFVVNCFDFRFCCSIFVCLSHPLYMVVEGCSRQASDFT